MFKISNANLTTKVIRLYRTDRAYGCYTRSALEMEIWPAVMKRVRYVVFCDIDDMHLANERYGYAGVDKKVRHAITGRESDIVVARWYSGDELVFIVLDGPRMGDPVQFAERIQARFRQVGLSATFGVVKVRSHEVRHPGKSVRRAFSLVQNSKKYGKRACVVIEKNLEASTNFVPQTGELGWLGRLLALIFQTKERSFR